MRFVFDIFPAFRSLRAARWIPLIAAIQLSGPAHSAVETFTIDPARSVITLSGTVEGANLVEQAPGSLATPFTGTIQVDLTPTTVRFPGGSSVVPSEAHAWSPGLNGVDGSASASYGAKGSLTIVIFTANAVAATRKVAFEVTSATLPRTGDAFGSNGLVFGFSDTANALLDYRVTGAVSKSGSLVLSGLSTNNVASTSSITSAGGVDTLTIPVNATYYFTLLAANDVQLNFVGNIVATGGGVVTEQPVVDFTPPSSPAGPLKLAWSHSYKLQRAGQLNPPDWADYAQDSPVEIPLVQAGEYFRVVPK